jgi:hypothetical protein
VISHAGPYRTLQAGLRVGGMLRRPINRPHELALPSNNVKDPSQLTLPGPAAMRLNCLTRTLTCDSQATVSARMAPQSARSCISNTARAGDETQHPGLPAPPCAKFRGGWHTSRAFTYTEFVTGSCGWAADSQSASTSLTCGAAGPGNSLGTRIWRLCAAWQAWSAPANIARRAITRANLGPLPARLQRPPSRRCHGLVRVSRQIPARSSSRPGQPCGGPRQLARDPLDRRQQLASVGEGQLTHRPDADSEGIPTAVGPA